MSVLARARRLVRFARTALRQTLAPDRFDEVRAFCFFVGNPRTGATVVGALLDAHPDVVIAHEANALEGVARGEERDALYRRLLRCSRGFARRGCVGGGGYPYEVPGQWQGARYRRLLVIGDKYAGTTSGVIRARTGVVDRLRATVGVPLRVIHVVRSPYDAIPTLFRRDFRGSMEEAAERYLLNCATALALREELGPGELHELRHEDFVRDPKARLAELCAFLGVEAPAEWLDACARLVFPAPRERRKSVAWPPGLEADIRARSAAYPFLAGYESTCP